MAAHLADSPRITLMWGSFNRRPSILRVYGDAVAIHQRDAAWDELRALFSHRSLGRQILDLQINLVLKSCGFGAPLFDVVGQRDTLIQWAKRKGDEGFMTHWKALHQWRLDHQPTRLLST